jgi:hypothetical protein
MYYISFFEIKKGEKPTEKNTRKITYSISSLFMDCVIEVIIGGIQKFEELKFYNVSREQLIFLLDFCEKYIIRHLSTHLMHAIGDLYELINNYQFEVNDLYVQIGEVGER